MRLLLSFILIASLFLFAKRDPWKGEEYAKNSESQKAFAQDFLQGVKVKGSERVLDVGCGDGKITAAFAKALVQGSIMGIDISPSMIDFATKTFSNCPNLSFQVEDAAKLSFENQFELIVSFTVMQWVLEQEQALRCFEKALVPGGKLWIQMPTGLPQAMEEALSFTIVQDKWVGYFSNFLPPWRFYKADEYRTLLLDACLTPTRMDVITKHEQFPSRKIFQYFLRQWFPYLRALPENKKDEFLTELIDAYLKILPQDNEGKVSFIVDRLEVEATK